MSLRPFEPPAAASDDRADSPVDGLEFHPMEDHSGAQAVCQLHAQYVLIEHWMSELDRHRRQGDYLTNLPVRLRADGLTGGSAPWRAAAARSTSSSIPRGGRTSPTLGRTGCGSTARRSASTPSIRRASS